MVKKPFYQLAISWVMAIIFTAIGVLNIILIHAIPGLAYILLAAFFTPPVNSMIKKNLGFSIPFYLKIVVFILIMWGTLGVGDLMEWFEANLL